MSDLDRTIASLSERLASVRRDFEDGLAAFSSDLEQVREIAAKLRVDGSSQSKRLRQLQERTAGQNDLISALTQEAQEARFLAAEVRERELEIERLTAELKSKNDLIHALRRQFAETEDVKATMARQQEQMDRQQSELEQKQAWIEHAEDELATVRNELEARKALVETLREDAERATTLAAELQAKRETIKTLEASVNRHVETNATLRRSLDGWKQKYQAAKGALLEDEPPTVEVPNLTDTEVDALQQLEGVVAEFGNSDILADTAAVNMRPALKEARLQKAKATT